MNTKTDFEEAVAKDDSFSLADVEIETTNWRLIYITGIISFLCAIEGAVIHMSEWPYMREIDPDATVKFFGVATALSKAAHGVFVLVFAVWSFKWKTIKAPLIAGRILAAISCTLYLYVEWVDHNRRYLMTFCYILFEMSGSSPTILRAYVAAISTPKDRSKAFATMSLSMVLSIICGPLIQFAFTKIPYPGIEIGKHLRLHVYSAPIWIANATNFITIAIIIFGLEELPREHKVKKVKKPSIFEIEGLKMRLEKISKANFNWSLVFVCWIAKAGKTLTSKSIGTLLPIILMVQYGWSGIKTVKMTSLLMGGSGVLSTIVIGSFMFCKLGYRINPVNLYFTAILLFISLFTATYPSRFTGIPVASFNSSSGTGCDADTYDWCEDALSPKPLVFLLSLVFVFGMTIPITHISLDTIYSKILGRIDQSVMQGLSVIIDDIMLVIAPIYASGIYTSFGMTAIWTINTIFMTSLSILWFLMMGKMKTGSQ